MRKSVNIIFGILYTFNLWGQLPQSHIYLFDFQLHADTMQIQKAAILTQFNSSGYNNQPYFLTKDKLLITSNFQQEDQTDIFQLNLRKKELMQVTDTDQSEYSPTQVPDGKHFSVIRVEPTQDDAQFLWKYPLDRKNGGYYLFKDLKNVGYHCWLDHQQVALFLVKDPFHQLAIGNIKTQKSNILLDNIGRTLLKGKDQKLYFVHKISKIFWYIKSYDPQSYQFNIVIRTFKEQEDFAMLDDGSFMMGEGSKLYWFHPQKHKEWKELFDFSEWGIKNITRLKVYENRLALVDVTSG